MLVEIIIPTYNRLAPLKCMLASLVAQTNGNWGANVVIDNPDDIETTNLVKSFNDTRIRWTKLEVRSNDWGHTPREIGKQASEAEYIIMSGDDNYYTPTFVDELQKASSSWPGVIYWDMVHSHYDYAYFKCSPAYNQIDMGAFATRKDIAHSIKLNTSYAADGEYIESIKSKYPWEKLEKIEKVLFVHN
jgi:glycosyltransferase involved in cell wall biosynthesis